MIRTMIFFYLKPKKIDNCFHLKTENVENIKSGQKIALLMIFDLLM